RDRLEQDGRDRLRPLGDDHALEVAQRALALLLGGRRVELRAEQVGGEGVHVAARELVGHAPPVARRDDRRTRVAVVGAVGRDDLVPARDEPGHADRVLDRVGTAVREEHLLQALGRALGDQVRRLAAREVRVPRCDRRERARLGDDPLDHRGVLVPDVGVDHLGGEVEQDASGVVIELAALPAHDRERVERALRGPRVEHVRAVELEGARAAGRDRDLGSGLRHGSSSSASSGPGASLRRTRRNGCTNGPEVLGESSTMSEKNFPPATTPTTSPGAGVVPDKVSLDGLEERWDAAWKEQGTFAFDRSATREEVFSIDTPPPTVSGSLHVGHVFSYTHTDVVARYQRMRGKKVFYPMGWDDNGLPTERRVQNYYGVRCDPSLPYDPGFVPPHEGTDGKAVKPAD